jgi:hypothetical protein
MLASPEVIHFILSCTLSTNVAHIPVLSYGHFHSVLKSTTNLNLLLCELHGSIVRSYIA